METREITAHINKGSPCHQRKLKQGGIPILMCPLLNVLTRDPSSLGFLEELRRLNIVRIRVTWKTFVFNQTLCQSNILKAGKTFLEKNKDV